jgi:hypothetical protein
LDVLTRLADRGHTRIELLRCVAYAGLLNLSAPADRAALLDGYRQAVDILTATNPEGGHVHASMHAYVTGLDRPASDRAGRIDAFRRAVAEADAAPRPDIQVWRLHRDRCQKALDEALARPDTMPSGDVFGGDYGATV